ncbi:hypothetical protein GLOIN_2v1765544 [Rhizophagus clarus]|uniref:Nematode cuticle collagen N-terminal domain-containing protein n=1 Tax=Rhizophagus clarus TaxID=94130 RepID=A0A8H3LSL8_9GLOM|nr:hypothetical protein GLOIN_2v1765544 [Rhizophagus clarus]
MSTHSNSHFVINFLRAVSISTTVAVLIVYAINLFDIIKEIQHIQDTNHNIYEIYNGINIPSNNISNINRLSTFLS